MDNTNKPISLEPQVQEAPPISLDPGEETTFSSPAVAESRAKKAEFALKSTTGTTYEDALTALKSGQENVLRKEAASTIDMQRSIQQRQLIAGMASKMASGAITEDQLKFAQGQGTMARLMGQPEPTNPDTVLEKYYAGEYLKPMYDISDQFNKGSFMPEAVRQVPEQVKAINEVGKTVAAKREIAQRLYQDTKDKYDAQSLGGWAWDQAKSFIPGYYELALRANIGQLYSGVALRGTALRKALAGLEGIQDPDEYHNALKSLLDGISSPQMKVDVANAALGMTTNSEALNNAFSAFDIGTLPVAGVAKIAGGLVRGAAVGIAEKVAEKAALTKATAEATKDVVKSMEGTGPTLREVINAQFGEQAATLSYKMQQVSKEFKAIASNENKYSNEGLRTIALNKLIKQKNDLQKQLDDLKSWHAENMVGGVSTQYDEATKTYLDIRWNQDYEPDPTVKALAGKGDLNAASSYRVANSIVNDLKGQGNPEKEAAEALPSALQADDDAFAANPGHGGQDMINRVLEQGSSFRTNILNAARNIMRVQRLPALLQDPSKWTDAIRKAVDAVKLYTKESYPGLQNSILNIANPKYQPITNTWHMDMIIGRPTGEYFTHEWSAKGFAKQYGLIGAKVEKNGLGWYIKVTKPLDETSSVTRDMLLKTAESLTPDSWLNSFLGWARTPEETLSFENRMQRKLATYNASAFLEFAKETARDIGRGGLRNIKNWREWERAVTAARTMPDPSDPSKIGYFFKDGGELDNFYQTMFKRFPTDTEKSAYFAYRRINEYDRVLRSMALYRNKARSGVEAHRLSVISDAGKKVNSDFFDGATRNVLPSSEDSIVVMGRKATDTKYQGSANRIPPNLRKDLEERVKRGELKVIELWDPERRPLSAFLNSDSRIRYVVTENAESKPISLADQVPRRGGGHWDMDYDSYVKQANIRFDDKTGYNWYEGDRTAFPMSVRGMGKDVTTRMNAIRELIAAGKEDEARTLAMSPQGLPAIKWEDHLGWYYPSKGAHGETIPPRFSKTEPFRVVDKDQMIADMDNELMMRYGESFKDGTRGGSMARQAQVQYTGERDSFEVHTLNDVGTRHNPVYDYEPAKLVDPITTMNRALSRIVNSTFMDDYKIYAVERWVREARPWLDVNKMSEIDKSPFHFFNEADSNWLSGMPPEMYRRLMDSRMKIRQLVGTPSVTDNFLHSAQQALVDSIYGKVGPKAIAITPSWLLPSLSDPFKFVRSIVFNFKMGLFAVPQLFVHAMTIVNAVGIAGTKVGFQGTFASLLHGWAHINPSMIDHLDGLASKMGIGWKPGEFKESMGMVYGPTKRTGFMDVAGEHAYLDTPLSSKIVQNNLDSFLDAGQMFFRGGVTWLRSASWHMAYKEFRELHPTGRVTDDDLQRILERADILSHNMTRASTSLVTKGAMSVPAQFYTYQLRLFELMTGQRLTTVEKARLFATNMAFFGMPAATGLYLYPFGDNIRNYANQNGYVIGDNFIKDAMMNGIPAMIGQLVTGTTYNVGGRYGAQGVGTLEDVWDGDKTILDVLGGASYSTLKNVWNAGSGFRTMISQAWRGEGEFQLTAADYEGPLKEISSVNQVFRTLAGINHGVTLTKAGAPLYESSAGQSIFQGITGLTDQRATDVWQKSLTLKQHRDYDNYLYSQFQKEFTLGTQAMKNKDPEESKVHIKNAFIYLTKFGYPVQRIPEAVSAAIRNNQSIIDRVDYDLFVKDPRSRDLETYNKIQSIKQGKSQ